MAFASDRPKEHLSRPSLYIGKLNSDIPKPELVEYLIQHVYSVVGISIQYKDIRRWKSLKRKKFPYTYALVELPNSPLDTETIISKLRNERVNFSSERDGYLAVDYDKSNRSSVRVGYGHSPERSFTVSTPGSTGDAHRAIATQEEYYLKDQQLSGTEDRLTEYKKGGGNYLRNHFREHLSKYICSFLNSEGGRLIIGVTDDGIVHGIPCDRGSEDSCKLDIDRVVKAFVPKVFPNMYSVKFIPVRDKTGTSDLKVLCISVHKDIKRTDVLYQNDAEEVYIRRDGSVEGPLSPDQIQEWCRHHFHQDQRSKEDYKEKEVTSLKEEITRKQDEIKHNMRLVDGVVKQKDLQKEEHEKRENELSKKIEDLEKQKKDLEKELESKTSKRKNTKSAICTIS